MGIKKQVLACTLIFRSSGGALPESPGIRTLAHTVNRIVELFLEDLERYCAGETPARLVDRNRGY